MKLSRRAGATSQVVQIFVQDSSSTVGAGLTGLAFNTASLVAYYVRTKIAAVQISLVTQTTTGAFSSGGFVEISSANMPGVYRLDIPDAALVTSADSVTIMLKGAANMAPCVLEIDLDSQVDVYLWNGTTVSSPATAGIPDVNVKNMNNVAATSITTINANIGATQPINFSGTGSTAYVKSDLEQWVTVAPNALNAGRVDALANIRSNTAQAGAASTITLDASASATNNFYQDAICFLTGGTGAGQSRSITSYVGSTKVATIFPAWSTNPDATSTFTLIPFGQVDVGNWGNGLIPTPSQTGVPITDPHYWNGTAFPTVATAGIPDINVKNIVNVAAALDANNLLKVDVEDIKGTASVGTAGYMGPDWGHVNAPTTTVGLTGTTIATSQVVASVTGAVGSVAGAVGSVTGNVGGNVVGSVGSVTAAVTLSAGDSPILQTGTATAGGASTITIQTAVGTTADLVGCKIKITSGTGANQERVITGYVNATQVVTVDYAWVTNPDNTSVYAILYDNAPKLDSSLNVTANGTGTYTANVTQWNGTNVATPATAGVAEVNVKNINNVATTSVTTVNAVLGTATVGSTASALSTAQSGITALQVGVNVTSINSVSTGSVSTINANQGTTQPIGFTGTGGSALVKGDAVDIGGAAAASATVGTATNLTNAPTSGDFTSTMKTSLNAATPASVVGAVGSVSGNVGGNVVGSVGSVVGAVGSVTGAVGSVTGAVSSVTAAVSLSAGDSPILQNGTATAGSASTITIQTALGADNLPNGCTIKITSGTGAKQARVITGYVNATQVATVDRAWTTNPDATSVYTIMYTEAPKLDSSLEVTASSGSTFTANVTQIAGQTVNAGGAVTFPGTVASPTNITAGTITAVGTTINLTNAPTSGDFTAEMKTSLNAATPASIQSVSNIVSSGPITTSGGKVSEVALVDTVTSYTGNTPQSGDAYAVVNSGTSGNSALHTQIAGLFTTAMTESYAANNVAPTPAQALFLIQQALTNFVLSGTSITINKLDGVTTAAVLTTDSSTNPQQVHRTS